MTDAEQVLWQRLRDRRLDGHKFRRQVTIDPFIVDFLCIQHKLIVEVDGSQHSDEVDAARTAYLQVRGYRMIRFWNNDVLRNIDSVLDGILAAFEER
jgi:very-short-patch-repair endonuclease